MTHVRSFALVGLALMLSGSGVRAQQFVLCDVTFTFTKDDADNSKPSKSHYYVRDKAINADRPKDWTKPVDYRNGTVHIRAEVIEKPAGGAPTTWTLCYIPNKGTKGGYGCTGTQLYKEKGVYERDVAMNSFWQNDGIVWEQGIKEMHLVMKDDSGGAGHAHKRTDSEKFFPTKMRITMVQVAKGSTYDPKLVPNLPAADNSKTAAGVFERGTVWPVHLTLSAAEFAAMQPRAAGGGGFGFGFGKPPEKPVDPKREVHRNNFGMDLPWATGSATVGGETFAKVGIRYKGNGTIGDAARTIKKSIKIDLDRAGEPGRFGGSKTINLHCGVTDPSKCREALGYELYRAAGVPAPRTALAEVRLTVPSKYDKELLGVYTLVEEVDRPFLRDRFDADGGLLFKPEGLREFEDRGDNWDSYKTAYAPKREPTKAEAARIIAFAKLVHKADDATFNREIASFLEIDGYLRYLAATAFVVNSDSFFALGHNYYLYLHPKTNRLHFIPWDLDRAFSNFPIFGSNRQQMNLSLAQPYAGKHRLTERLLAMPGVGERYQKLWTELSASAFEKSRLLGRLAAAEAKIQDLRDRDAKAAAARKEAGTATAFGTPPPLRKFIDKRTASVAAQIAGTAKGYVPNGGSGPPPLGPILAGIMLENLDTDTDELLARDEWLAIAKRLFKACAKDAAGTVKLKSLTAGINSLLPSPPETTPGAFNLGGFLAEPILTRADADKDERLTSDELIAAAGAIFDEYDKKKAGKIDEDAFAEMLTSLLPNFGPPPARK